MGENKMDLEEPKMKIERAIEILNPEHQEHYDGLDEVNEACRMGMEALGRQRWIAVSEGMPDKNRRVLFWAEWNNAPYTGFYHHTGSQGAVWFRQGRGTYTAKFWMPLPEPPEEGGEGNAAD